MNLRISAPPDFVKVLATAIFLFPLVLAAGPDCHAQEQHSSVGYPGSMPMPSSVDELQDEMSLGKPAQREDLLKRLGVDPKLAQAASTYVSESSIRVERLARKDLALIFLPQPDAGGRDAHLLLLQRISPKTWKVVADEAAGSWWKKVGYELISIPGQRNESVLVHHVDNGHGSGFVAESMEVLGIRNGRFVKLIETQEFKQEDVMGEDKTVIQQSSLLPFPDGSIEETQATSIRTRADPKENEIGRARLTKIERRRWRWQQSSQKFEAGPFSVVSSRP